MTPKSIGEVVRGGLCTGCGLCAKPAAPPFELSAGFFRPTEADAPFSKDVLAACPGINVVHGPAPRDARVDPLWGPVVTSRTGASTDDDVRHRGSSGGVLTALLLHLLEAGKVSGIVQVGMSDADPLLSIARISRTREEIIACAGSRYAPSPTLLGLTSSLVPGERYALVGKPCEIVGFRNLASRNPALQAAIPYAISFMCAGVPSQQGTTDLLSKMGAVEADVRRFRYRGHGWPGEAVATHADGVEARMTYERAWGGVLSRRLQFRCKICPDGSGEFADVVGGDAWYGGEDGYPKFVEREGRSLILTRTSCGEDLVRDAIAAGAIAAQSLPLRDVDLMQPYQTRRKKTVLARIIALFLLGRATPDFRRLGLLRAALRSSPALLIRSFFGTVSRIVMKSGEQH